MQKLKRSKSLDVDDGKVKFIMEFTKKEINVVKADLGKQIDELQDENA